MQLVSRRSRLKGSVAIPASKSHTIRAVAIASLAQGDSIIRNPLWSGDTEAAVLCYRAFGARIDTSDDKAWKVTGFDGKVTPPRETIDVLNSGTTLRVAMGSAALAQPGATTTFTGDDQIQSRPIAPLMQSLEDLGARCVSLKNNGKAPVQVSGGLRGGRTSIAAFTSQYLSSLLLCTPLAPSDTDIEVTLLNEPGYVQMTLDWLDKQGIQYESDGLRRFHVCGGQTYRAYDLPVPADFSSATFFLCAAALFGDGVTLQGLDFSDSQPDKAVVDYLRAMGADITTGPAGITVKASALRGVTIDMNATPDALPAMAVTAAYAEGTTRLVNVPQARSKETDRIKCMAEELAKMGANVEELPDGLVVHHSKLKAARLDGRSDHRIVMALSLAAMGLDPSCTIETAEAIEVTFPEFVNLMQALGANMEIRGSS
ncbi:MAG TPA: 3-phosphoshikimate 1-carboxyvinyltransferase [Sedimentisphaerales bacterium]|jgi:3-phosphoshikimate 1-carboxyvinyltransferase|nr:3-phosphoshikimate 1-carboxyvinyltransferase [Sedimentisphaerales bacterium]HNU28266.1 3-phosphoshikimate 1-carboxyvinyltransferase [Sedimentisphaerales bacterium]